MPSVADVASASAYDERKRLSVVHRTGMLEAPLNEANLKNICETLAEICSMPIANVQVLDEKNSYTKASFGAPPDAVYPREVAVCHYVVQQIRYIEIPDLWEDNRFNKHLFSQDSNGMRFYAGAPLIDPATGQAWGSEFHTLPSTRNSGPVNEC